MAYNDKDLLDIQNDGTKTAKKGNPLVRFVRYIIPMPGDKVSEIIRKLVFVASIVVFIVSLTFIFGNVQEIAEIEERTNELRILYNRPPTQEEIDKVSSVEDASEIASEHIPLLSNNPDYIGWISVPNTNVTYPVYQAEDNVKYLRHDVNGNYSISGEVFADYRNVIKNNELTPNTILYGHNMFSGHSYFTDLVKYKDLDFYKETPVLYFDSIYNDYTWQVFAVVATNAKTESPGESIKYGDVWKYHNFIYFNDNKDTGVTGKERFDDFINEAKSRSYIDTGVDVNFGDYILTLSTCDRTFFHDDWRWVIFARLVPDGENPAVDTSGAKYNSNVKMPDGFYTKYGANAQPGSDGVPK